MNLAFAASLPAQTAELDVVALVNDAVGTTYGHGPRWVATARRADDASSLGQSTYDDGKGNL